MFIKHSFRTHNVKFLSIYQVNSGNFGRSKMHHAEIFDCFEVFSLVFEYRKLYNLLRLFTSQTAIIVNKVY